MSKIQKFSDNSDPKINFFDFFSRFFVIFLVLSKKLAHYSRPKIIFRFFFLIFRQFFWCQKCKNLQTILIQNLIFLIFFSRFFVIFWCYPQVGSLFVSENSDPKISFRFFFSIFCHFFWYNLKVGSFFASENSEPRIIFRFFFLDFCQFFGII